MVASSSAGRPGICTNWESQLIRYVSYANFWFTTVIKS